MKSLKKFLPLVVFFFWASGAHAQETFGKGKPMAPRTRPRTGPVRVHLTAAEIDRVKALKELIRDVDKKTLQQTIDDLERADNPQLVLQMDEAIAKTYADIVREEKVVDPKGKEWLYGMVTINMAYLQFGANADESRNALNQMIRRKLREYLPADILNSPGFRQKLDIGT